MARYGYAVLLTVFFLTGCLGSDSQEACTTDESTELTKTEELALGSNTFNYIRQVYLTPQGLEGDFESLEPYGQMYKINFTFGGAGMPATPATAYVTSEGMLFVMNAQYCPIVDTTKIPEPIQAPAPTAAPEQVRMTVSIDDDYCLGEEEAPVTIVEFTDYGCFFCKRFWEQTLPQIKDTYLDTGKVKLVLRDFPITNLHPHAHKAAEATECAGDQDKFWEMHDKLFESVDEWNGAGDALTLFKSYAVDLELDEDAFTECLDSGKYTEEAQKDLAEGSSAGVTGTPAFFINGIFVKGAQEFSTFQAIIEDELAENGTASTITGNCTGKV